MIASRLGVAITAGIALMLAIVLAIDVQRQTPLVDRALVQRLDVTQIVGLKWTWHGPPAEGKFTLPPAPNQPPIKLSRPKVVEIARVDKAWRWTSPTDAPANEAAIDAALTALRSARWHRAARESPVRTTTTLEVVLPHRTIELRMGDIDDTEEQAWIEAGGRAFLVDSWVARALAPAPVQLRIQRPLVGAQVARRIVVERSDPPFSLVIADGQVTRPATLLPDPALVDELARSLEALTVRELGYSSTPGKLTISLDLGRVVTVELRGMCNPQSKLVAIDGTEGSGCIDPAEVEAIERALAPFETRAETYVERRPVPFQPATIDLPDGTTLDLKGRPRIGDRDADPTKVAELLAVIRTPATPVTVPAEAKPTATLTATDKSGMSIVLELFANNTLRRRGEPDALQLAAGASAILTRPAAALRDPTLWTEEPTTIGSIAIDATTYTRGAVLGEWTRAGPGGDDPAAIDKLAALLAAPRGFDTPARPTVRHRITITIAPPTGGTTTRTLELGDRTPAGCPAIVDGRSVLVAAELCDLVR